MHTHVYIAGAIVEKNGYSDQSSNPLMQLFGFLIHVGKAWFQLSSFQLNINSRAKKVLYHRKGNRSERRKIKIKPAKLCLNIDLVLHPHCVEWVGKYIFVCMYVYTYIITYIMREIEKRYTCSIFVKIVYFISVFNWFKTFRYTESRHFDFF